MPVARRTQLGLVAAGATALFALAAGATIQHVPEGHVGLARGRIVPAGWTLHAPFASLTTIAARGEITSSGIPLATAEGSTLGFDLELRYAVTRPLAPQLGADVRSEGLVAAVTRLAHRALEDVAKRNDVESLLSEPSRVEAPLAAALQAAGVGVDRLSFRSTVGDELVRRKKTEEAKARTRQPLARILVVGWDGADWRTAEPLMASGRMPNLARLVREGASGNLRSNDPMFSPLLWTTVATGKAPTEHGVADFLVKDGTGARHPITSDFRKVKALWNILGEFDRASSWIGWWASFPAESIRGSVVTDYLSAAVTRSGPEAAVAIPGIASPAGILKGKTSLLVGASDIQRDEVARIIPVTDSEYRAALADIAAPAQKGEGEKGRSLAAFVMRVLAQARTYHNIALDQLRAGVPFVAVYYEAIDEMGHGFQHYLPPKMSFVSDADFLRLHDAVPNFYAWQDERLGELLSAAGRGAVTLLLSDHGFRTGADRPNFAPSIKGQPEEWHRDWGIVLLHGPGVLARRLPPSSIFDIAPTLLYVSGLPLADDMPGQLIASAFDPHLIARRVPSSMKSYELVGARLEHAAPVQGDPEVMREMMANLKALGYVGGAEDAPQPPAAQAAPLGSDAAAETTTAETQFFFHRNLAVSFMRQGRYREAEAELLLANARQPRAKTYAMLSEARARESRFGDAAAALEDGWTHLPAEMEPSSLLWIVELHLLSGDRAAAAAVAARWAPKMSAAVKHAVDGRLAEAGGDVATAAGLYRQALGEDPLLVRVALRLQPLEAGAGRPFALEPFLQQTLSSHPEVDAYWDLAGQLALARADTPTAVARFRKATDIEPENAAYLGHLASAEAAAGRTGEARDALGWADRFPPRDVDGWMAIGSAWDRLGDTDKAVAAFRKARDSSAGPGADLGEALALARAGRMEEARRVLADALRRYPESAALKSLATRFGA
jgi:tetratricopeptide (TPR) repeat protein